MRKIFYFAVTLVIIGGGYYGYTHFFATKSTPTRSQSITVSTGSIRSVVKATGKVYPVQESNLTFTKQGTITAIYKRIWDTVTAWELIAELDAKSIKLDLANAKINLSNAQNNLQKLTQWSQETNRIKSENTLSESEAKLVLMQKQYDALIEQQKNSITTADANISSLTEKLALAKSELEYAEQNISIDNTSNNIERDVANAYSLIESSYQLIEPSIKTITDTLLLESKATSTYGAIWENNQELKAKMEALYIKVKDWQKTADASIREVRNNSTSLTNILIGLNDIKWSLSDLSSLSAISLSVLRASKTGNDLPSDFLDKKISSIDTLNTTLTSKYSNINSTLATLKNYGNDSIEALADKNTIAGKKSSVTNAQNELTKAKSSLEELKRSNESSLLSTLQSLESQKNIIKLNQASYKDTINSANTDLVSARNSVQSAQISVQKSELALKDYQIYSTFDGIIKDIPWVVWDTVTSSSTSSSENISITNSGGYEIRVSLDQVDIVKVQPGMNAKISLDAYAGTSFDGVVSSVSPTPVEASNVVSYTAKILMPKVDKEIYSNMSATVQIIITEKNDIITIPTKATKSEKGKTYVEVLSGMWPNTTTTKTEITIGNTDDANVEVLSGVTIGQKLKIQTITSTGSTTTRSNTSGFGWGAGGPPF